jgi:hypothetical protein
MIEPVWSRKTPFTARLGLFLGAFALTAPLQVALHASRLFAENNQ